VQTSLGLVVLRNLVLSYEIRSFTFQNARVILFIAYPYHLRLRKQSTLKALFYRRISELKPSFAMNLSSRAKEKEKLQMLYVMFSVLS
jgi:hypothetical protein